MPLNVVCEEPMFRGLKCPYTGKVIKVIAMAAGADMPWYFSPDAYDPSALVGSSEELFKMLSMRKGVMGVVSGSNLLICPYTGNQMSPQRLGDKHHATGGFNPTTPVRNKIALVRNLMMRGGKVPKEAPKAREVTRIQKAVKLEDNTVEPINNDLRKASTDQAEEIFAKLPSNRTSIVVPGKSRSKKSYHKKNA